MQLYDNLIIWLIKQYHYVHIDSKFQLIAVVNSELFPLGCSPH